MPAQLEDLERFVEKVKAVFYLSLDVEATGPFPGLYSLVSVGCVPVYPGDGRDQPWRVAEEHEHLYLEFQPLDEALELPAAMEVHGLTLDYLREKGREPAQGIGAMAEYLAKLRRLRPKFMMAAWPASFDLPFVGYYAQRFLGDNPFGYGALDIGSLAQGLFRCERRQLRAELVRKGLFRPPKAYPHHALEDALDQANLLVHLLNLSQNTTP